MSDDQENDYLDNEDYPRQILTEVSGFTPVFDVIVDVYQDKIRALVFGAIWRFCQMEDKVCKASLEKIGKLIGVDKATVQRHVTILCNDGYLKDLTPGLRHRPHVYADTGRVLMRSKIEGVAVRKPNVAQRNASVAQSTLIKDINKDLKGTSTTTIAATPNNFSLYESNIGPLTPMIADSIKDAEQTYSPEWVARAIQEAAKSNVRRWNYIEGILRGYKERGSPDIGRDFVKSQQTTLKSGRTTKKTSATESNEEILRRVAQNVK
ncbi:MAG TPA: DnaD domain protein [Anaerolineales bacterium]|nr:DnaD domain protein [Anaerolineales bacterium]